MPSLPSAAFSINGAAVGAKVSVASGAAVVATLDDITGVAPVSWEIVAVDDTSATTDYAGAIISGSVDQIWSGTALTAGKAAELKCTVNGGVNPITEVADKELMSYSVKFYVETIEGKEVYVAGEVEDDNRLGSATHGIIEGMNADVRSGTTAIFRNRTVVNFGMNPYTVLAADYVLGVTTAGGALQIDLPAAADNIYRHLVIKDEGKLAGGANITIDADGGEFIDGVLTAVIAANGGALNLYCDGVGWYIY